MQREFTVPTYLKIIYYLLGAAIIGAGVFLTTLPNHGGSLIYFLPFYIAAIGLYIMITAVRRKVTITDDTISVVDSFKTKEIATADIQGIRFGQKRIIIVPKNSDQKALVIRNYGSLNASNRLVDYLTGTFTDLDAVDQDEEQRNLLQDPNLGFTVEERQAKLDNAKKVALGYNVLGVIVAVGCLFLKQSVFTILAMIYPLLSIAVIVTSKGLIKFSSDSKRSVYPFVIPGFFAPAVALFIKSMALYRIYSFDNFWLPFIGLGVVVAAILFRTGINTSINKNPTAQLIFMAGLSLFYAFGTVDEVNCGYDKSPDQIYKASVLGHHISHGKSTSYYLYLSTWGPCHEQKQVDVGSKMYYETNIGDSVKVDLKAGLLHIPWFVVRK